MMFFVLEVKFPSDRTETQRFTMTIAVAELRLKYDTRLGIGGALMKVSVGKLAVEDMLALPPTRLLRHLKPVAICFVTIR